MKKYFEVVAWRTFGEEIKHGRSMEKRATGVFHKAWQACRCGAGKEPQEIKFPEKGQLTPWFQPEGNVVCWEDSILALAGRAFLFVLTQKGSKKVKAVEKWLPSSAALFGTGKNYFARHKPGELAPQ